MLNVVAPFNDDTMTILVLHCRLYLMSSDANRLPNDNMFVRYCLVKLDIIWCCEDIGQYFQAFVKS